MEDKVKSRKQITLSQTIRMELSQQQEEQKPVEGPQLIKHKPSSYDEETGQLYSFCASTVNQTQQFFRTFSEEHTYLNNQFSFTHKQKVIKYVFDKTMLCLNMQAKK
ncbi:unnamed protein product (macronuclear) [Paramecium tetraurelia]|uniref:Uncharacterized protein n=1 Tax=Paramecium tetraurelia TaxID=5888 RepID=A0E9H3_PARTE|nr:uncharacterized protein GSPATT00024671001 [Paramecium tetraurelia]CAK91940.1 unnamed protein product [Paramecium tetraurelia]|eukprot:XP_001459337.1 hypothetical protein (macronuclear) [Paramecium tetraurelia strain d4-2]